MPCSGLGSTVVGREHPISVSSVVTMCLVSLLLRLLVMLWFRGVVVVVAVVVMVLVAVLQCCGGLLVFSARQRVLS